MTAYRPVLDGSPSLDASVGIGSDIVRLQEQQQRRHYQAKPTCHESMRSSALSIAPSVRAKAIHSISKRDKRAYHVPR